MSRFLPGLRAVLWRFPVPALIAILGTIYANLFPVPPGRHGWAMWGNDIILPCLAGMLAACSAHYFARSRLFTGLADILFAIIAGFVAAMLVFQAKSFATVPLLLILGLAAFLPISGSLRAGISQGATWRFALDLTQAALFAIIVGQIFRFALAPLGEVEFLRSVDLLLEYRTIVASLFLVSPLAFLAFLPDGPKADGAGIQSEPGRVERALLLCLNYLLIPVVLLYAVVLHSYAFGGLFGYGLPDGIITWLTMLFILLGSMSWVLAWPWRNDGSVLLRLFLRNWGWLTIIPLMLLTWAAWERVAALGLTPERYGVFLVAVWLASAAVYWLVRREEADIRLLLGGLAVLLIIGSFGPWGAKETSAASQATRLIGLLEAEQALTPEGKLLHTQPVWNAAKNNRIGAALSDLSQLNGLARIRPLFAGRRDDPFVPNSTEGNLLRDIRARLKIEFYVREHDDVRFNGDLPLTQDVGTQSRLIGPVKLSMFPGVMPRGGAYAESDGHTLFVTVGQRKWDILLQPLMEKLKAATAPDRIQAYVHEVDPNMSLVVSEASGTLGEKQRDFRMTFWLILRQ